MESVIYLAIIGFIAIVLAIVCSILNAKNKELQHKADKAELAAAESWGEVNKVILLNAKLQNDLDYCRRKRDEKGRYIKK